MDRSIKPIQLISKKEYRAFNLDTLLLSAGLLAAGFFINGADALRMASACLLSGIVSEYICYYVILKTKSFANLSAFASSLLIALLLPATAPLYTGILASAFAVFVAKLPFGDGRNTPFVPAAAGFCFAAILFPDAVFTYTSDALTNSSLLDMLTKGNGVTLDLFGLLRLATGSFPGAIGTAVPGALGAVFLYRLVRSPKSLITSAAFMAASVLFVCLFPRLNTDLFTCIVCEMCAGSLAFTALMLINDPVTAPKKPVKAIIYGFIGGIVAMLLRCFGNVYDGSVFAVLIMNFVWPAFFGKETGNAASRFSEKSKAKKAPAISENKEGGDKQ